MGPRRSAHLAALFADFAAPGLCFLVGSVGSGGVDQPASGCPSGFSKKYLEGQQWCAITVIMIINA